MNDDLRLALSLADAVDEITMRSFRQADLQVRTKSDRSPVSEADEGVETMLRDTLARKRPADGILGEEFGSSGSAGRRWIIDPIDGTSNYVRGIPVFATLLALEEQGRVAAGVITAPALQRRWWASAGEGSWCNGSRLRVSSIETLEESHLAYDSVTDFDRVGTADRFLTLVRRCTRARGFGDFWSHMLVAEGAIEIAIEPVVAPWDMAAVQIIVEEAGGRFSALDGSPRFDAGSGLSTNGSLHEAVLEIFR
jgi:histidinol-phosphatase